MVRAYRHFFFIVKYKKYQRINFKGRRFGKNLDLIRSFTFCKVNIIILTFIYPDDADSRPLQTNRYIDMVYCPGK